MKIISKCKLEKEKTKTNQQIGKIYEEDMEIYF
jgi:hypothetical protein